MYDMPFQLTDRNWMKYYVNDTAWGRRKTPYDLFRFAFEASAAYTIPFIDAVYESTRRMLSNFANTFKRVVLFFSGGIDSEIALRALAKEIRNFRMELATVTIDFGFNRNEIQRVGNVCNELGVGNTVYQTDLLQELPRLEGIGEKYSCSQLAYLPLLSRAEDQSYEGSLLIFGGEVQYLKRWSNNYAESQWYYAFREDEDAVTYRFTQDCKGDRALVNEFFSYTPELFFSYFNLPEVQKVFRNEAPFENKLSLVSSKNQILNTHFFAPQGMQGPARKLHGYENILPINFTTQQRLQAKMMPTSVNKISVDQIRGLQHYDRQPHHIAPA